MTAQTVTTDEIRFALDTAGIDCETVRDSTSPDLRVVKTSHGIIAGPATDEDGNDFPGINWTLYDEFGDSGSNGYAETLDEFVAQVRSVIY